jgi:BolA protein
MAIQADIERKLSDAFEPRHLEVINESHMHSVPKGSESHFKVVMVADAFDGEKLIARHRRVNSVLAAELAHGVHALALHTYTLAEWQARFGAAPLSPPCHGGSRRTDA